MQLTLIEGSFQPQEAVDILTQMIQVKIRHHEAKISASSNEEDVKNREARIKELQYALHTLRNMLRTATGAVQMSAKVDIEV